MRREQSFRRIFINGPERQVREFADASIVRRASNGCCHRVPRETFDLLPPTPRFGRVFCSVASESFTRQSSLSTCDFACRWHALCSSHLAQRLAKLPVALAALGSGQRAAELRGGKPGAHDEDDGDLSTR